jgi:membrane-associated phospholipid phosphatase
MRIIPDHCSECSWFFSKMGACPNPDALMFFSYVSLIPYFIIFYLIVLTFIQRKLSLIRLTSMLVVAYIVGDKILKNVFQSNFYDIKGERPPFSCKNTYGMPSSHMTVMAAVAFYVLISRPKLNIFMKIGLIILCILQGIARIELHYHTL